MDIFEKAMQMETDGEAFYRGLAATCPQEALKVVWNRLAADEQRHYQTFKSMREGVMPGISDAQALQEVKNFFTKQKKEAAKTPPDADQADAYRKGMQIEKDSEEFYRKKAAEVPNPAHKAILLRIADEEKKHYGVVEDIVDFITAPERWLEDAEISNLEEY